MPLVSVLMTAYNREKYIAEAIESVLISTYQNFELIIVDDCSIDRTVEIAKKYAVKDSRIKVFVNELNIGQFPNRNKAAFYATGEFLMFVDSDDTIQPDSIVYIMQQFNNFPKAKFSLIYGLDDIKIPVCLSSEECIRKHFFISGHLQVGPGGTIIKTDYFMKIGGFPIVYGAAGDSYYNIKAACNSDILLLPYFYLNYRIHGNQELNSPYEYLYNGYRYFEDIMLLPELPLTENEKRRLLLKNKRRLLINTLKYFKQTGNLKKTLQVYKKAGVGFKELFGGVFH